MTHKHISVMFWIALTGLLLVVGVYFRVERARPEFDAALNNRVGPGAIAPFGPMLNSKDIAVRGLPKYANSEVFGMNLFPRILRNNSAYRPVHSGMKFPYFAGQEQNITRDHVGSDESVEVWSIGHFEKADIDASDKSFGGSFPYVAERDSNKKRLVLFKNETLDFAKTNPRTLINLHGLELGPPLIPCNPAIPTSGSNSDNFETGFPPWHVWMSVFFGFIVGWWGWHNIRNNRRTFWGICAFIFGMMVLNLGISSFMAWSAKL